MLSGSIQFHSRFQFKSNHAVLLNKLSDFLDDQCQNNTYTYFIYNHLWFIDQIQIYTSICNKSLIIKSCISQYSFHFNSQSCFSIPIYHNLKSIQFGYALNKFNLCFRYTGYRNHRHGPAGLQADIKNGFITQYGPHGLLTCY